MNRNYFHKGITLPELLIAVAIISAMTVIMAAFQADLFNLGFGFQSNLSAQFQAERMLKDTTVEIRSAEPSSQGAYPIKTATETEFTFFTDPDGDGDKNRVRYFLDGTVFKKGEIVPEGAYHVYDEDAEEIVTLIEDVRNDVVFTYYDENYNGVGTTTALTFPVERKEIRLVEITLVIDNNENVGTNAMTIRTRAMMRNLKDNL